MKNATLFIFIIMLFSSCKIGPCSSKEKFTESFQVFINDIHTDSETYSDEQWEKFDTELKQFTDECYKKFKSEMSGEEKRKYWSNVMNYYYTRYGNDLFNEVRDNGGELTKAFSDEFEEVLKSAGEELKDYIDGDLNHDLKELIDNVVEGIEDIGEQLKKELEEQK